MIKKILAAILPLIIIYSCSNDKKENPSTPIGAGSSFIRATLDGDFDLAETLLLKDTQDMQLFESYKIYYDRLPEEKKKHYRAANYKINKYVDLDDSTTIINYSNDYMNKPMEIKVVKENKEWKVDFKYTYSGNLPID